MTPADGERLMTFWPRLVAYVGARSQFGARLAEDVAGEAYARAVARWPQLAEARDPQLFGWLCVTAGRILVDRYRHEAVRPTIPLDEYHASAFPVGSDRHADILDGRIALDRCAQLAPDAHAWLAARCGAGLSAAEMGTRCGLTALVVKGRTYRARLLARQLLHAGPRSGAALGSNARFEVDPRATCVECAGRFEVEARGRRPARCAPCARAHMAAAQKARREAGR